MDKLIPAFQTTLFDPRLSDMCIEMAELSIDSLLDEGVFKSIPIVALLVGLGKTAQNVHDRNLLKQTVKFINTFNEKSISTEKLEKYKEHLCNDPKYAEEELGRVLIVLNSNVDIKKSELLGKFFHAYVEGTIDWTKFCELSDVTTRMFISDIDLLLAVYNKQITDTTQCGDTAQYEVYRADRLLALGLLTSIMKSLTIGSVSDDRTQRFIRTSQLGNLFCKLIEQTRAACLL